MSMQKCRFRKGSLWGEGGLRLFGRYPAMWDRNTRHTTLLLALVAVALQGCVILPIPTPEHGLLSGRGEITQADVALLEVGKTAREEVLLRFGEPSASLNDQQVLIYHWGIVRGYLFWGFAAPTVGGAADVAAIPKNYLVLLEFDEQGRLKRFERTTAGLFQSTADRVDQWTPPGSARLADITRAAESSVSETRRRFIIDPVLSVIERRGSALAGVPSVHVKIADFVDERTAGKVKVIGQRTAAFGVVTHDIHLGRGPSDVVRDAVVAQWEAAGHRLVDDNQDVTVRGRLMEFKIETPVSFTTWDAVGILDVIIEVRAKGEAAKPITRRYHSRQVEKTVLGPSEKHFESVILSCLQDLMHQMASDADLLRYVVRAG